RLIFVRAFRANSWMMTKCFQPICSVQAAPYFVSGIEGMRQVWEWPLREHLLSPAFRATAIQQSFARLLRRKAIELFQTVSPILLATASNFWTAKDTEPRDTSIGIDVEADMRCHARAIQSRKYMSMVGFQVRSREKLLPHLRRAHYLICV